MVEHLTFNQVVVGSIPTGLTTRDSIPGMAAMGTRDVGVRSVNPWLLRQVCDELDAMKAAGDSVPDGAYAIAEDMCHLVGQGVSVRIVAEHAVEVARRILPPKAGHMPDNFWRL